MKTTASGTGSRAARTTTRPATRNSSTPFDGAFDAPLRLRTGAGPVLGGLLPAAGALLAGLAFLAAPLGASLTLAGLAIAGALGVHGVVAARRAPRAELLIERDGAVEYREHAGMVWRGRARPASWQRRYLALLSLELPWGRETCVVFRHRQRNGEFRRLRAWLRHRGRAAAGP